MITQVAPGATVVFRAYAVDGKTRKVIAAKDVKYFYVKIPNQPNVKLTYNAQAPGATPRMPWSGTWTVPAAYPLGTGRLQDPGQARRRSAAASSCRCRSRRRS